MNHIFLMLCLLAVTNSFIPSIKMRRKNLVLNCKKDDLFDKFEKYSKEKNEELQNEYLFKIYKFLTIKTDFDNFQKSLLEEDKENQSKYMLQIHKYIHRTMIEDNQNNE